MSQVIGNELPPEIVELLPGRRPCAVATVAEDGGPYVCLMAGVIAVSPTRLRLGCWGTGTTVANIRRTGRVTVETLGPRAVAIICDAGTIRDPMENSMFPPHPYVLVEASIRVVKDDAPPGLELNALEYDYGALAERLLPREDAFMQELREYEPALAR
jgi:hypothetical protein